MRPPFRSVLIANRGEIAVRIARACQELGCQSIAVFSDADAGSVHVRAADRAVRIGPSSPAESYLNVEAIVAAARDTGADALHPGYGFLSERAVLAEACEAAGVTFVGPSRGTLAGLGDKLAARRAVAAAGVPVVPGTSEPAVVVDDDGAARVARDAEAVGWPLLVKAAAGGGGRGMRRVDEPGDLLPALAAASAEATAAFGDGSVYLERYLERARHVEVQLLGDGAGSIVALGERDCSVQRRHQKLVEEAPAPGLTVGQRRRVHEHAVRAARTFGLRNAATVEFLLTPDGSFWFLEVNTRLQVEHGVTELVSGVDLVQEQLWIASGRPLGRRVLAAAAAAARPTAHAIEVRLSAEDPGDGFRPAPGTITAWQMPGGPGVRVDAGVEMGSRVATAYDPLLAKLLVVATDRRGALARLRRALDEVRIGGIQTTLPFDRWIATDAEFAAGRVWTGFVDARWQPASQREAAAARAAAVAAAAVARNGLAGSAMRADGSEPPWDGGVPGPRGGLPGAGEADPDGGTDGSSGRSGSAWAAAARREATERWPS